jgi:hypothetical protein
MSKQTAVEWLLEQSPTIDKTDSWYIRIIEQAKQMEKEQVVDAWENGIDNCGEFNTPTIATGIQYYNQTYTNEK